MRVVVDTNFLQHQKLRDYLAASKHHSAVLTDYVAMEAYRSSVLDGVYQNMQVLSEFPTQVVVLHGTQHACGLTGAAAV